MMSKIERAMAGLPAFRPRQIEREEAVEAARVFLGLPYNESNTFVSFDENGKAHGHLNCHGLFFAWAQRLDLVGAGIWRALQIAFSIAGVAPVLHAYMLRETREASGAAAGDWLLFRWRQASPTTETEMGAWFKGKHHIALLSDTATAPNYRVIHAVDTDAAGKGGTYEVGHGGRDHAQIHIVRTLPQFVN